MFYKKICDPSITLTINKINNIRKVHDQRLLKKKNKPLKKK